MSDRLPAILPGDVDGRPATLGVLGGGQLGRMFVHAAQQMGYFTVVLDPDSQSPAGLVSHHHIVADYMDTTALDKLAALCDAVTTEFENVPAPALAALAEKLVVSPGAQSVAIAQDRAAEKANLMRCGVPCAPYAVIDTPVDLDKVSDDLLPGILKTSRMGYDGKGQIRVKTRLELQDAWNSLKSVPCVLEKMLPLALECSVIVVRGRDGDMVSFPVQRNLHRDGILAVTEVYEGNIAMDQSVQAIAGARSIAQQIDYVGVLCVEFFVLQDGSLIVNEMAPRPHNSGHYTIDACDVSQFDLQVRALTGLPLPQPRQHSAAVMLNLLGDLWFDGDKLRTPKWDEIAALGGAQLHLYGKRDAKRGRKMGHLNITAPTAEQAKATALRAAKILGIEAF